jgi:hypothetical protein
MRELPPPGFNQFPFSCPKFAQFEEFGLDRGYWETESEDDVSQRLRFVARPPSFVEEEREPVWVAVASPCEEAAVPGDEITGATGGGGGGIAKGLEGRLRLVESGEVEGIEGEGEMGATVGDG